MQVTIRSVLVTVTTELNNDPRKIILPLLLDTYVYCFFLKDDLIDDVQSFAAAAEVLKERGAYKIYVLATHGLLSSDAPRLIEDSPIDEVRNVPFLYYH